MKLLQFTIMLTTLYVVYIDQAITNIPGFSIAVYLFMDIVLLYYNYQLRFEGGLLKELSYEGKAYIAFFAVIFIPGLITSPDKMSYLYSLFKGIHYAILFISVYYVVKNKKSMEVVLGILAITILAYALTAYLLGTIEVGTGRLMISERGNPNEMAVLMYIGIVLVTYFWNKGLIYKFLSIGYIPIALSNIALSGSRKGFIGTGLFLTLFIISSYLPSLTKKNIMKVITSLIIIFAIAIAVYNWYAPMFSNSILFERLSLASSADESAINRMEMYRQAFELFKQYPVFGVGYDNYKNFSTFGVFSHSTYAEVLSCTGIVGTFIYFSIYVSLICKLIKLYIAKVKQKLPVYVEGILLSFVLVDLVFSFVRIDLYDPVIYVLLACIAGYCEINKSILVENNISQFEQKG